MLNKISWATEMVTGCAKAGKKSKKAISFAKAEKPVIEASIPVSGRTAEVIQPIQSAELLPVKDLRRIHQVNEKMLNEIITNCSQYLNGKAVTSLVEDFAVKKERLIRELSKVCTEQQIAALKRANTPEEMTKVLFTEEFKGFKYLNKILGNKIPHKVTLEMEQIGRDIVSARTDFILARERAMHVPSTNPQVIAIENILKEQYGVRFVSLKDNETIAKNVLKAFEISSKNGIKLPKNVIVSDFMMSDGEHIADTILIQSEAAERFSNSIQRAAYLKMAPEDCRIFWKMYDLPNLNLTSTNAACHLPLHEILHGEHPSLMAFSLKKIPKKHIAAKECTSLYSAVSDTHETFTELNTKRLLEGLNPKEEELYRYLNFYS